MNSLRIERAGDCASCFLFLYVSPRSTVPAKEPRKMTRMRHFIEGYQQWETFWDILGEATVHVHKFKQSISVLMGIDDYYLHLA